MKGGIMCVSVCVSEGPRSLNICKHCLCVYVCVVCDLFFNSLCLGVITRNHLIHRVPVPALHPDKWVNSVSLHILIHFFSSHTSSFCLTLTLLWRFSEGIWTVLRPTQDLIRGNYDTHPVGFPFPLGWARNWEKKRKKTCQPKAFHDSNIERDVRLILKKRKERLLPPLLCENMNVLQFVLYCIVYQKRILEFLK